MSVVTIPPERSAIMKVVYALVKFYTGFPTYDHFKLFFELAEPTAETMVYV